MSFQKEVHFMILVIILILVLAVFFYYLHYVNKKRLEHLIQIAPDDLVHYQGINLVHDNYNPLEKIGMDNKHHIRYIGVDKDHRVLFPESKFGNQARYYLTSTSFSPKLSDSGHPEDNVKAAINVKGAAYSDNNSQSGQVYLTLLKDDLSNAFKIAIKAQQADVNALNQTYALSAAQLKALKQHITKKAFK